MLGAGMVGVCSALHLLMRGLLVALQRALSLPIAIVPRIWTSWRLRFLLLESCSLWESGSRKRPGMGHGLVFLMACQLLMRQAITMASISTLAMDIWAFPVDLFWGV